MEIYIVKQGDTVNGIASDYGVDADRLIFDNQLVYPYRLAIGQAMLISNGQRDKNMAISSNGYAYPFISEFVLDSTLPYLSELSVFSYGFTTLGELVPPELDDTWMIDKAWQNRALPILTLTPLDISGNFNNNLISAVVRNPTARDRLINELISVMQNKGYGGLDIDFEFIKAEDRDAFTEFVRVCTDRMHAEGYQVSVALAPKTSAEQKGVLYEGKDYRAIGEIADHVLIMTYEWGYTYGPPMAVAP
ncbi:MAG: LysM peptidoglycan-binding domain-containing protein, partial [Lachnospiraceae bacterium]|nr:LysM peptidoglycan-binding domain-containing protein [Lachnospiraceae bacterium]